MNLYIIGLSSVLMLRTGDLSPLPTLIGASFTEFATATGFYYHKAKIENRIKLKQSFKMQLKDEDFKEDNQSSNY